MRVFPEYQGPMEDWPRVEALPYAVEVLALFQPSYLLAIATSARDSAESQIWGALQRVNLAQYLSQIYCYRRTGRLKSDPEFYGYILDDLGRPPDQIVMVGDDWEADIESANQAGLRAIWLNTRSPENISSEMYTTIHSLHELPDKLKHWGFP